ncbi:hypothetical protein EAY40_24560, partial [Vibrio anguillarum]|nr:hypothetical protein [Vibrio anguillarum]
QKLLKKHPALQVKFADVNQRISSVSERLLKIDGLLKTDGELNRATIAPFSTTKPAMIAGFVIFNAQPYSVSTAGRDFALYPSF